MIDLTYWFMFPLGILIATIAMMSGIGGALFFSPIFLVFLKLEPRIALATSLFIELFGFSSGLIGYVKNKSVIFSIVKKSFLPVILFSFIGVVLSKIIPSIYLKLLLALLLILLSFSLLIGSRKCHSACFNKNDNNKTLNNVLFDKKSYAGVSFGSLLIGMVSSGLGEINEYLFIKKMGLPLNFASGTSVFLVSISAISGIIAHSFTLIIEGSTNTFIEILPILIFTIPGVIFGAQLGVILSQHFKNTNMEKPIGVLFFLLSILIITTVINFG